MTTTPGITVAGLLRSRPEAVEVAARNPLPRSRELNAARGLAADRQPLAEADIDADGEVEQGGHP